MPYQQVKIWNLIVKPFIFLLLIGISPNLVNRIYLIAVRSHGGDGDASQNPFVDSDPSHGLDQDILKQWETWFAAMDTNGIVIYFGWDIINTRISDLEDYGRLVQFMESTNFNEMAPHDELRYGGTEYVMALPGESYIARASSLSNDIGLKNVRSGIYNFKMINR